MALAFLLALVLIIGGVLILMLAVTRDDARLGLVLAALGVLILLVAMFVTSRAEARDLGQWQNTDPKIHEWYKHLTRPDAPQSICCTEADAYWADEFYVRDGKMYVRITDDRDDLPLGRPHIANGREFEVPPEKLKHDEGNPTGHGVLFVSSSGFAWCYVQGTGI